MVKKHSKQNSGPRRKTLKRTQRLQSAKSWLPTYKGNSLVKAYRERFGVDWPTAFKELEILGVSIDPNYKSQVLNSVQGQAEVKKRKRIEKLAGSNEAQNVYQNEEYAFIAGHTSWGFPYGITWEELEELDAAESEESETDTEP